MMEACLTNSQLNIIKKVFDNILNHPNEAKYRIINVARLNHKFHHTTAYLKWFYQAGFVESDDVKQKLILYDSNLNKLRFTHSKLIIVIDITSDIQFDASYVTYFCIFLFVYISNIKYYN